MTKGKFFLNEECFIWKLNEAYAHSINKGKNKKKAAVKKEILLKGSDWNGCFCYSFWLSKLVCQCVSVLLFVPVGSPGWISSIWCSIVWCICSRNNRSGNWWCYNSWWIGWSNITRWVNWWSIITGPVLSWSNGDKSQEKNGKL